MKRRTFVTMGAAAAAAMSASGSGRGPEGAEERPAAVSAAPPVLAAYSAQDHRTRLQNIAHAQQHIRRTMRKHLVTGYLPGQCCYNLGEYPCLKPWDPDAWDEQELDRLRDHGIRLIQVHEEWNDSQRRFGSHKLAALNPAGFRRFVEMVHRRGMRLIVYVSSGYFDRKDPDFRPEWATRHDLREIYFQYAHCSPASPGWRAYFLKHLVRILDDYGIDGLYNDLGYSQPGSKNPDAQARDEVLAFDESPTHDGALGDLLGLIYAEVNRRGGVVKVHIGGTRAPKTDVKVYDYLWVGEGGKNADLLRNATKNHTPYVVPCLDMSRAKIDREDDLYLHAIPYMQFPLLLAGRPFTGQRAVIPGIEYPPENKCFWTRHCLAIWKHFQAHPEGPHSYGWWDSAPGRPEARATHQRWLRRYLPLVEEGTWAWLEVADSDLWAGPLPGETVASVFANRRFYLVLANYGSSAATIRTADAYVPVGDGPAQPKNEWTLNPRSLQLLERAG